MIGGAALTFGTSDFVQRSAWRWWTSLIAVVLIYVLANVVATVMVATASRRGRPGGMPSAISAGGVGPGAPDSCAAIYCKTVGASPPMVVRCIRRWCFAVS